MKSRFTALLRMAWRDLIFQRQFLLLFTLNLYLGLFGLTAVETLRGAISSTLQLRAKSLLGADLTVGARRPLTNEEKAKLAKLLPAPEAQAQQFEVYTMFTGSAGTRLIEVRAIEHGFPFYGELVTSSGQAAQELPSFYESPEVLVFPELLMQLNLKIGDRVKIGDTSFLIRDTIAKDSSGMGSGFEFAPPVYVGLNQFHTTGLLRPGSTGYFSIHFKFKSSANLDEIIKNINSTLSDPAIQVTTPNTASEQVGRGLAYLTDYLGLTALVGLLLCSLSQYFLLRRHLLRKQRDIAVLKSIGATSPYIFIIFITQMLALSLGALAATIISIHALLPLLEPVLYKALQIHLEFNLTARTLWIATAASLFGGLLVTLPALITAIQAPIKGLLSDNAEDFFESATVKWKRSAIQITCGALTFAVMIALAMVLANSIQVGLLFSLTIAGAVLFLFMIGRFLFWLAQHVSPKSLLIRTSMQLILFHRQASLLAFIVLSLTVALASLIPQISQSLQSELQTPRGLKAPSLFLFDIQDEQLQPLHDFLKTHNLEPLQSSPMIRARLVSINGQTFEKSNPSRKAMTREEENENRFRNRGFNLSYRNNPSESERITDGLPFSAASTTMAKISLEERFAKRLGVHLNDKLVFEIQGVEIEGQVVNFRKVRWTSFQPNFFIQFEDGPLHDAPKTHIITLPKLSVTAKADLQKEMIAAFPNISILDVARVIEKLSGIMQQMAYALMSMATFTTAVGLAIAFSILNLQMQLRSRDMTLFKQIGAPHRFIRVQILTESILLTSLSLAFGLFIARIFGITMAHQLFDSISTYTPSYDIGITVTILSITTSVVWWLGRSLNRPISESLTKY